MDFLDPNNDCGQSILKLAAKGSAITAELMRLSNHIPEVFLFDSMSQRGSVPPVKSKDGKEAERQS